MTKMLREAIAEKHTFLSDIGYEIEIMMNYEEDAFSILEFLHIRTHRLNCGHGHESAVNCLCHLSSSFFWFFFLMEVCLCFHLRHPDLF